MVSGVKDPVEVEALEGVLRLKVGTQHVDLAMPHEVEALIAALRGVKVAETPPPVEEPPDDEPEEEEEPQEEVTRRMAPKKAAKGRVSWKR